MQQLPTREYTSAGGVVADEATSRVLVLLRPGREGPDGRPEVRLPKGHVEPGESRREAALREVREEAGVAGLEIVADLGHQHVEFDHRGHHYVRDEYYYLMAAPPGTQPRGHEEQWQPVWLLWEEALQQLTFEAEREWLRRARAARAATTNLLPPSPGLAGS